MRNELIEKLSILEMQRRFFVRQLNKEFFYEESRNIIFKKLSDVEDEIKKVKFKIRLERKIKNGN
nr:MAG TPA: hypothetical protein [Caudoviricetes sp.]